jgi:hypothetical protein
VAEVDSQDVDSPGLIEGPEAEVGEARAGGKDLDLRRPEETDEGVGRFRQGFPFP